MRYLLAVLTHGDNAVCLTETIESFKAHVTPRPHRRLVVMDGPCALPPADEDDPMPWAAFPIVSGPVGFCAASRTLWQAAAACKPVDYVFWLEHDFRFDRDVDLRDAAHVIDSWPQVAQVALMRGPVNEVERTLGGVVGDHRERGSEFIERTTIRRDVGSDDLVDVEWLEHGAFFTTNPSLMRRDFMAANPWPAYPSECEGRFGLDLVQRGYRFAFLGAGEPWVTHTGVRTGHGY